MRVGVFVVLYTNQPSERILGHSSCTEHEAVELADGRESKRMDRGVSGGAGGLGSPLEVEYDHVMSAERKDLYFVRSSRVERAVTLLKPPNGS